VAAGKHRSWRSLLSCGTMEKSRPTRDKRIVANMLTEFKSMKKAIAHYEKFGFEVIHDAVVVIMFDTVKHVRLEKYGWSGKVKVREI